MILDVDDDTRDRLSVSAARYAVGRRTYAVGCVAGILAANAGRFGGAANARLRGILDSDEAHAGIVDPPYWKRALTVLETAGPDTRHGLEGGRTDLTVFLTCAFRRDMGGDGARMWLRLLDMGLPSLDAKWRAIAARDLYEAGYAPEDAPKPPIQYLEPLENVDDPAWADVYRRLMRDA